MSLISAINPKNPRAQGHVHRWEYQPVIVSGKLAENVINSNFKDCT